MLITPAEASSRSLKLYNTHTGERVEITFKKNGRFIPSALRDLNRFLRDWRRNESIKMDPELFDLVWDVYQKSGSKEHIHVVSGYRSPATNNMLRRRSRGVAKFSQHMRGKAMDFFLPDVKISALRKIGLRKEVGGVGYYPKSNSPFVHMDTGTIRHWPRMTRRQLASVFPDGKTVHVPSDGKPMPGYKQAQAELKRREQGGQRIVVASNAEITNAPRPPVRVRGGDSDGAPIRPVAANRSNTGTGFIASLFSNNSGQSGPRPPADIAGGAARAPGAIAASSVLPGVQSEQAGAGAVVAIPGVTPLQKPVEAEPEPEPVAEEVPILVAALPLSKPQFVSAEPARIAALATTPPTNPADAISALTDVASRSVSADENQASGVLSYASAVPSASPRPLPPVFARTGSIAARSAPDDGQSRGGSPLAVAALPSTREAEMRAFVPQRVAGIERSAAAGNAGGQDPFARFEAMPERGEPRFLMGDTSTRTEAFAELRHPDQRRLAGLIGRPARLLVARFEQNVYGALRTDQFIGPAVVSLPVMSVE